MFPIQNGVKQDVLSPLLLNFALVYTIRKVQENQMELKLNGTYVYQLLVYADDIKLLEDYTDTIKKNTEVISYASKKAGLEVNTEKTKYILLYCQQDAGHNHDIKKIANRPSENVALFEYLRMAATNQNVIQEKN
jgi:hypothetical protein